MLFPLVVLLYFLILNLIYTGVRSFDNKIEIRVVILFVSFLLLEVLRLYCQQYFPDIPEYRDIFKDVLPISKVMSPNYSLEYYDGKTLTSAEPGFLLFVSIFKFFSLDFSSFLFFVSLVELLCFYYFCKRMGVSLYLAIPIYLSLTYLTFQIGMLRQALAFCLLLIALLNISNRYVFFILIIVGYFLHRSMAFCCLLYFSKRKFSPKVLMWTFLVSLTIYLLKIEIIQKVWVLVGLEELNRVDYYFESEIVTSFLGVGFWERVILFIFMYIAYKFLYRKNQLNEKYILLFNLGVFVIFLQLIFYSSPVVTSRLRYYIVIFPILFISLFVNKEIKNVQNRLFLQLPIYSYLIMYLFTLGTYITQPQ